MGGEPWCFTPGQIAKLTDYQIEHLYLAPAARRAREWERKHVQPTATAPAAAVPSAPEVVGPTPGELGGREDVVKLYMEMGLVRAAAEAAAREILKG